MGFQFGFRLISCSDCLAYKTPTSYALVTRKTCCTHYGPPYIYIDLLSRKPTSSVATSSTDSLFTRFSIHPFTLFLQNVCLSSPSASSGPAYQHSANPAYAAPTVSASFPRSTAMTAPSSNLSAASKQSTTVRVCMTYPDDRDSFSIGMGQWNPSFGCTSACVLSMSPCYGVVPPIVHPPVFLCIRPSRRPWKKRQCLAQPCSVRKAGKILHRVELCISSPIACTIVSAGCLHVPRDGPRPDLARLQARQIRMCRRPALPAARSASRRARRATLSLSFRCPKSALRRGPHRSFFG